MSFENETFDGVDSTEPAAKRGKKSQEQVLRALDTEPLEQARRAAAYVRKLNERKVALLSMISPAAKSILATHDPDVLA